MILQIDFETRSEIDLKKAGAHVYAMHPSTDVLCMAWAFDNDPVELWTPQDAMHLPNCPFELGVGLDCECPYGSPPLPYRVVEHLHNGEVRAWNAQFERLIWKHIMAPRYGAPEICTEQFVCTAAEAAAMSLPRSLDQAGAVLRLPFTKDNEGYKLMLKMSKPRKRYKDGTVTWWDTPEMRRRLGEYCKQDVRTERAAAKALHRLTPTERELYLLDQRINDRGVQLDTRLIHASKKIVDRGMAEANDMLSSLTLGEVESVTKNAKLTQWLRDMGVDAEGVSKPVLQALLDGELSEHIRQVLTLRQESGRASVAKLDAMVACMCPDDRARGLLMYLGAARTGRWAGRLIQPQNFPRGEVPSVETFIPDILAGRYDAIDVFAHPVVVIVSLLRAMLTATPGSDLLAGDFSAIEARVLNWLAGQDDVLENFRAMDLGDKLRHPYKRMAVLMGRAANTADVIKPSDDYQAGKAAELGCGFQMGWKKFIDAAWDVYKIRVTKEQAKMAVTAYRESHPEVKAFWYGTEMAYMNAIQQPGTIFTFGGRHNLHCVVAGAYLIVKLPSGRRLFYAQPKVESRTMFIDKRELEEGTEEADQGLTAEELHFVGEKNIEKVTKPSVTFMGLHQKTKRWQKHHGYGGFFVENIVQAVARDLLAAGMLRAEAANYPLVLSVHDELVAEREKDQGSLKEFEALLSTPPAWAVGCPIATEGWRGERYRK